MSTDPTTLLRTGGSWLLTRLTVPLTPVFGTSLSVPDGGSAAWRVPPDAVFRTADRHRLALAGRIIPPTTDETAASTHQFPDPRAIEVDAYCLHGAQWLARTADGREYPVAEPPRRVVWSLPDSVITAFLPILQEALTLDERALLWDLLADVVARPPGGTLPDPPDFDPPTEAEDLDLRTAVPEALSRLPRTPSPDHVLWEQLRQPYAGREARAAFSARRFRRLAGLVGEDPVLRQALRGRQTGTPAVHVTVEGDVELALPTSLVTHLGLTGTVRGKQSYLVIHPDDVPDLIVRLETARAAALDRPVGIDRNTRRVQEGWVPLLEEILGAVAAPDPEPEPLPASVLTPDQRAGVQALRHHIEGDARLTGSRITALYQLPDGRAYAVVWLRNDDVDLGFVLPTVGQPLPAPADFHPATDWSPVVLPARGATYPTAGATRREEDLRSERFPSGVDPGRVYADWRLVDAALHAPRRPSERRERLPVGPRAMNPPADAPLMDFRDPRWFPGILSAVRFLQLRPIALNVGYDPPRVIGCGHFGCAFRLPEYPGWVLKITADERDVLAWAHVDTRVHGLPRVPLVWAFPRDLPTPEGGAAGRHRLPAYLYGYVQEVAAPLPPEDRFLLTYTWDDNLGIYTPTALRDRVVQALRLGDFHGTDPARLLARVDRVLAVVTALRQSGIHTDDLGARNIGLSPTGEFWIYDLGLSCPPSADLPVLGSADLPLDTVRSRLHDATQPRVPGAPGAPVHERYPVVPTTRVYLLQGSPPLFHVADLPRELLGSLRAACTAGACAPPVPHGRGRSAWILDARGLRFLLTLAAEGDWPTQLTPEVEALLPTVVAPPDPCRSPTCERN